MNKMSHRPIKNLGQNFLIDTRIQERIVDACSLGLNETVLEIGPGKGAITRLMLPKVEKLIVVEKDRQLAALLKEELIDFKFEVVEGDFLKWDMNSLPNHSVVVGNIPYYISTPIIEKILEHKDKIQRAYMLVQLEFGQRLAALPGNKDYGSLSCFVQYYADIKLLFKIKPGSFHPAPKVESCFISLIPKEKPDVPALHEKELFQMIQRIFTQRRKTILNALKAAVKREDLLQVLQSSNIDPQSRPEQISLLNYIKLANNLMV